MQSRNHLEIFKQSLIELSPIILCCSLLGLVPAVYSLQVLDEVLKIESKLTLVTYLFIALIFIGLEHFFKIMKNDRIRVIFTELDENLKETVIEKTKAISAKHYSNSIKNNSKQTFNNIESLRRLLSGALIQSITEVPFSIFALFAVSIIAPQMLIICFLAITSVYVFNLLNKSKENKINLEESEKFSDFRKISSNYFDQKNKINTYNLDGYVIKKLKTSYFAWGISAINKSIKEDSLKEFLSSMQVLTLILSTSLGAYLIIEGQMSIGSLIACNILIGKALFPMFQIIVNWGDLQKIDEIYSNIKSFISNEYSFEDSRYVLKEVEVNKAQLSIKNAYLTKPRDASSQTEYLLEDIDLTLQSGLTVLLGDNGSGKSSLLKALSKHWLFDKGTVELSCNNIENGTEYSQYISLFAQEYGLDLITFEEFVNERGKEVNSPEVVNALKIANCKNILLQNKLAEKTKLSKTDYISQGQLKRIMLSLAIVNKKRVYIFDEPTNELDLESKKSFINWVADNKKEAIIICASHDESLISQADYLIKIDNKRLIKRSRAEAIAGKNILNFERVS